MKNNEHHQLFNKASNIETELELLEEIVEQGNELLCSLVALNPKCNKQLLDKLSSLNKKKIDTNLSIRYTTYPKLYSLEVREIKISDADYVLKLRLDDSYSKYLSKVSDDLGAQVKYINHYIEENSATRSSFYFILKNSVTGKKCGTVRIYNFNKDTFEWGSWILDDNKTLYAAMETAIFIYEFAFNSLGFYKSEFEVNKNNEKVVSFHKKSGAKVVRENNINYYFRIEKEVGLKFAKSLRERLIGKFSNSS